MQSFLHYLSCGNFFDKYRINYDIFNAESINPGSLNFGHNKLNSVNSILDKLIKNQPGSNKAHYINFYQLAEINLKSIEFLIKKASSKEVRLLPTNLKNNLSLITDSIEKINKAKKFNILDSVDEGKQGIGYIPEILKKINILKSNGAQVNLISGHSYLQPLQKICRERGAMPEYYNYIATGESKDVISSLKQEILKMEIID